MYTVPSAVADLLAAGQLGGPVAMNPFVDVGAPAGQARHHRPRGVEPGHGPVPPTGASGVAKRDPRPHDELAHSVSIDETAMNRIEVATDRSRSAADAGAAGRMACGGAGVSHNAAPKRRTAQRSTRRSGAGALWVVLLVVAALVLLSAYGLGVPY